MLTKEKFLRDKISLCVKSPESNEDYVKLIKKLIELGWKTYDNISAENFSHYTWVYLPHIDEEYFEIHPRNIPFGAKEIQVLDILGEEFYKELRQVKPIEKWSVGSYVVFLQNYGCSNKGTIDVIKEFDYSLSSSSLEKEGIAPGYLDEELNNYLKWFATLPEAEAFSKSLLESEESKTLSVDNLVEGEIYFTTYDGKSYDHIFQLISGDLDRCENFCITNGTFTTSTKYFGKTTKYGKNLRLATPKEKKWLLTCIKQDEFISLDQLDMYDSEGNLLEDKPKFKIGDYVITNRYSSLYNGRILRITKFSDRYPDIAYFEVFDDGYYSKNDNFSLDKVERFATSEEIAKVTKPEPKESKEFDRNWYIEVSSQEEADKVFEYLESIGESVVFDKFSNRKYLPLTEVGKSYKYIYYLGNEWFLGENPRNRSQKQLSDILPNYSPKPKVNRNVYYEVSNQEEYEEILGWLKSMGEKVDRGFCVNSIWNFVYYHKDSKDWYLGCVKPDLPKAEFPFKGKSEKQSKIGDVRGSNFGMWEQMKPENIFPVENFEIRLTELKQEPRVKLINVPRI